MELASYKSCPLKNSIAITYNVTTKLFEYKNE